MDPQTTRKLTSRSSSDLEATNNSWQTPPAVYAKLNADFGPFFVDLTADATNHLLPDWVGPGSVIMEDALEYLHVIATTPPPPQGYAVRGYSNPVYHYGFVNALIPLCGAVAAMGFGSTLLLPLRTTSEWWAWLMAHQVDPLGAAGIYFCDKRICFYEDGHPRWNAKELAKGHYRPDSAVFDSVIVHFADTDRQRTRFALWEVPPHVPRSEVIIL